MPPSTVRLSRLSPWASVLLCLMFASGAAAQSNSQAAFSTLPAGSRGVLKLNAELQFYSSATAVLNVSINSPTASKADRDLTIVYYIDYYGRGEADCFAYHLPVRLAEGQKSIEVSLPHSQERNQAVWDVGLFEDGRDIEDRRSGQKNNRSFQWLYNDGQVIPLGTVIARTESQKAITQELNELSLLVNRQFNANTGNNSGVATRVVPVAQAATDWLSYFSCSGWTLSDAALRQLQTNRPEAAEALRQYVAAGGVVLIHSLGPTADPSAVEELFGSASPQNPWEPIKASSAQWWMLDPDEGVRATSSPEIASISPAGAVHDLALLGETWIESGIASQKQLFDEISWALGTPNTEISMQLNEIRDQLMKKLSAHEVLQRKYMFGEILVSPKPLEQVSYETLQQTSFTTNQGPLLLSPDYDGNWFYRNLIRAVGKPPVWTFCAIVAIFGAALGPGLLYLTARIGRRSLMIFLVPAISLVATAAIVGYGILHEGFDTHIRVTSVQMLADDGQSGFAWSRQNYFSGLPPREGLKFNADTFARPVYSDDNRSYGGGGNPRQGIDCHVYITPESNVWLGWLRARQQQQLLIGHHLPSIERPINVTRLSNTDISVRNQTDGNLPLLILRGEGDEFFVGNDIPAGSQVSLQAVDYATAASSVARQAVGLRPSAPPELDSGGSLLEFGSGNNWRTANNADSIDILNVAYRTYLSDKFELPPFGFALLATESSAIEIPLRGDSVENLHLIVGAQVW